MLTQQQFKEFREDFKEAVKELELKYGVSVKLGKITYTDSSFTSTMEVFDTKEGKTPEQVDFENRCYKFFLNESDFGKEIVIDGKNYAIAGINGQKRKFPIILKVLDGSDKLVTATAEAVRKALGKSF